MTPKAQPVTPKSLSDSKVSGSIDDNVNNENINNKSPSLIGSVGGGNKVSGISFLPQPSMLPSLSENLESSGEEDDLSESIAELDLETIAEDGEDIEKALQKEEDFKKAASIEAVKAPVKAVREQDSDLSPEAKRNTLINATLYQLEDYSDSMLNERLMMSPALTPIDSPLISASNLTSTSSLNSELLLSPPSLKPVDSSGSENIPSPKSSGLKKRVAFDTFTNDSSSIYETLAFTLQYKHTNYRFQRTSRTFLVGYDENESSLNALKWAIDEMITDGDTLVCLRAVPLEDYNSNYKKDYKKHANKIIEDIMKFNKSDKAIAIVMEFSVGKVPEMITKAIRDYDPVALIVGTRGIQKTGFKNLIASKSMSKHCLQYADVPVVVINPLYEGVNLEPKSSRSGSRPPLSRTSSSNDTGTSDLDSMHSSGDLLNFQDRFKEKLTNYYTFTDQLADTERSSRFKRGTMGASSERSTSTSRSRSKNFSPARTMSPLRFFRRKDKD